MRKAKFRLSLRRLLIAISLSAILIGLWGRGARKQAKGVSWVARQGGHVTYEFENPLADGSYPVGATPPGPKWVRNLMGLHYATSVTGVILDRDEISDLEPLKDLPQLRSIALMNYVNPDVDWSHLTHLEHLENLQLGYTGLDAREIQRIRMMLPNCDVTEH